MFVYYITGIVYYICCITGVPKRQPQPGGWERGHEQRGVHVPLPRLGADGARQGQRRGARLLHQVRRRLRQPRLQHRVRQLPVCADAGQSHISSIIFSLLILLLYIQIGSVTLSQRRFFFGYGIRYFLPSWLNERLIV